MALSSIFWLRGVIDTAKSENSLRKSSFKNDFFKVSVLHRRRINTKEKAKVIAAVRGTKFIQFLASLAIFIWKILKKRINSFSSSNHPGAIFRIFSGHRRYTYSMTLAQSRGRQVKILSRAHCPALLHWLIFQYIPTGLVVLSLLISTAWLLFLYYDSVKGFRVRKLFYYTRNCLMTYTLFM